MEQADTRKLIESAKLGDKNAFGKIYETFFSPVFRYIYFRVKNKQDAQDLAQDVFLKTYKSLPRLDAGSNPLFYFFALAKNAIIDQSRKKKPISLENTETNLFQTEHLETTMARQESLNRVKEAILALPEAEQETIVLRFINGLATREIAQITRKTPDNVRQIQSRGLKKLRDIILK